MTEQHKTKIKEEFKEVYNKTPAFNDTKSIEIIVKFWLNQISLHEQALREKMKVELEKEVSFWRECHNCGHAGNRYLHCLHDGNQSYCVECDGILSTIKGECECEFVVQVPDAISIINSVEVE